MKIIEHTAFWKYDINDRAAVITGIGFVMGEKIA